MEISKSTVLVATALITATFVHIGDILIGIARLTL